jgi:hypothetical protein
MSKNNKLELLGLVSTRAFPCFPWWNGKLHDHLTDVIFSVSASGKWIFPRWKLGLSCARPNYWPPVADDRGHIYFDRVLNAFLILQRLAFPFLRLVSTVADRHQVGLAELAARTTWLVQSAGFNGGHKLSSKEATASFSSTQQETWLR